MTIPVLNSVATVIRDIEAALTEELPAVLATLAAEYETAYGVAIALPEPSSYWRTRVIPGEWTSPGVGIFEARSAYAASVKMTYDEQHGIAIVVVLDAQSAEVDDTSSMEDALRLYGWAVSYTACAFLAREEYGGQHGVYLATPVDTTPIPIDNGEPRGQYLRMVQVQIRVDQRVLMTPQ